MATFIFTWDGAEKNYGTDDYLADIETTLGGGVVKGCWGVGVRRPGGRASLDRGDRAFLLKQHGSDRGIIASGHLVDGRIYEGEVAGEPHWVTDVDWDMILAVEDRLPIEALREAATKDWDAIYWSSQELRPPDDRIVNDLWDAHLKLLISDGSASHGLSDISGLPERSGHHGNDVPGSVTPSGAEVLTVSTATSTRDAGLRLAESAIGAGLAAGGQVAGPVASVFWHSGEFGQGEEWVVSFKTTAARYDELEAHLIAHHEWRNPEVTAVPLARASAAYVEWVERVTAKEVANDG